VIYYKSNNQKREKMKVGDLVRCGEYLAIVIVSDAYETLIRWLDDGVVEDANIYTTGLEVISESR
tara:strand:+ start:295 stop:489 length:195 start_codon:yes stop_codon:yes gene_type:complete